MEPHRQTTEMCEERKLPITVHIACHSFENGKVVAKKFVMKLSAKGVQSLTDIDENNDFYSLTIVKRIDFLKTLAIVW